MHDVQMKFLQRLDLGWVGVQPTLNRRLKSLPKHILSGGMEFHGALTPQFFRSEHSKRDAFVSDIDIELLAEAKHTSPQNFQTLNRDH